MSKTLVSESLPDSTALDARSVGEEAERLILSLPLPRDRAFEALYNYVAVDEPAIHLMPLHFLPGPSRRVVGRDLLHALGVAAKLEYVRSRWVDEVVDLGLMESTLAAHRLHDGVLGLILDRYSEVLSRRASSKFFRALAGLYARHGVSVSIDGSPSRCAPGPVTREAYASQVSARNGSFRASVDAVQLLAASSEETSSRARKSWHSWVLGAQLYDDALDVEEDFESDNSTWTVDRTLAGFGGMSADHRPDRDAFYEAALTGGSLTDTLEWAESCFASAARLSEVEFPSWAALQRACITQASRLREDLQELAAGVT